jgi:hypothetical protein
MTNLIISKLLSTTLYARLRVYDMKALRRIQTVVLLAVSLHSAIAPE